MIHDIFMPALSSTMTEGKIVSWVKSPGDKVEKGETVLVVESDKADMDVESFNEGYLAAILVEAGQEAAVGATLGLVAETEAEIAEAQSKAGSGGSASPAPVTAPPAEKPVETVESAPNPVSATPANGNGHGSGRLIASPRAKKLAKEFKVDLAAVAGTGPHGRIVAADIEKAAGKTPAVAASTSVVTSSPSPIAVAPSSAPAPVAASVPVGETVPLTTFQKALVQNMVAAMAAPVFRVGYTITTDELDKLYKQIKAKGVTMTALLAKAVAMALKKHPVVNASYTDQGIVYHRNINVSLAVAMPDGGLITPVLQNADQMDIYSLSRRWKELVERARAKQLQPEEYSTGTFTISNLGMFGVDRFDAILPPGQGGILAIGASRPQMVVNDEGLMGVKRQMAVNVTCDHRVIYGAHAAAFLKDLAAIIETNVQALTL
jgi:pyruvate dehydrogenase E2 component (dihydrolipoamide acetyltransferase)